MKRLSFALALLLCISISGNALAQTSNATLGGTVSDTTGALIPGVEISATNTGTGIVSTTVTNESGAYNFPSLQTGAYSLKAELPGFQTQTMTNVTLGISQQVRLNFKLEVGGISQQVEVSVAADTLLATSSASVGSVLPEYKVRDLPTVRGNVLDLIGTSAGAVQLDGGRQGNFAGQRVGAVNVTRDGVNVMDGRYEFGAFSAVFQSPDMVEEVRVIVAPSDAETSRGSGQVQLSTRSGTNQYRGSVYWTNSNSALNANTWVRNFNGNPKDYYNRNEYGVRLGGPIVKNKTFFFGFFTGQRVQIRETVNSGAVLTAEARKGIFRYYPGVDNGNAIAAVPTVDRNGNPVRPAGATGDLQSFNVFGPDPLRTTFDTSAWGREQMARMPLPNDFTGGDGLNTARIRFVRRVPGRDVGVGEGVEVNRDQYNLRLDHSFNQQHKLSIIATREKDWAFGQPPARVWPTGFDGTTVKRPDVYTIKLVSTLSSSVVNELTLARKRSMNWAYNAANRDDEHGREALSYVPSSNGIRFRPYPILTTPFNLYGAFGQWREGLNPQRTVGDSISWTMGKHAFKGGLEWRSTQSNGFNDPDVTPRANFGAGSQAVVGIDSTAFTGLSTANATLARNLLLDLSGSINQLQESFVMKDANDLTFYNSPTVPNNRQILFQRELSSYFKDDWKVRPTVTLNFGVHWEWYGAPWEKRGLAGAPTSLEQLKCGYACGLTNVQLVGKNSPHPDLNTYNGVNDMNNFAPNLGMSWNLPGGKTVLRLGYGVSYEGALRNFIGVGGVLRTPGMFIGNSGSGAVYTPPSFTTLSQVQFPMPKPIATPLLPLPLDDKSQTIEVYDHVSPYTQNFNVEIQRELMKNTTLEVRYVSTKGTKLWGGIALNTEEIFSNGILSAFNTTRAGGNADLFDRMLMGINIGGGASTVNGTTVTGSQALRLNSTTRTQLANGNVGALADFLNRNTAGTGKPGGLIRTNKFPENFITPNPQFQNVTLDGNPGNSTYHSLQLQFTKRLSQGFTNSTTYTWGKTLGEADGDGGTAYRNPRDRSLSKQLLGFDRRHAITSNGTWELPFGPGRSLLGNAPKWISRLVEKWQFGGIFSFSTGAPLTITAGRSTIYNSTTDSTPDIVGAFTAKGEVVPLASGATYFKGYTVIDDPYKANVTATGNVVGSFSNRAIVDPQGKLVFVNPQPGTLGTYGLTTITGPSRLGLDMNLIKRVTVKEGKEVEVRVTAENVLNHPNWGNPDTSINSTDFGRITTATGNRTVTTSLRFNF